MLCTNEWQFTERIIANIYASCMCIKKKKSALWKLVHCPTKRQGTWQTLPLILLLCRWLLPSFLQLNSSLGKCSPRGIRLPEKAGKEVAAGRSWSYPANHPWWLLCCRNMEAIPIPFLNMNMHHTTTSKIGLLLFRTTKVFLYIIAAKSYGGAHTLPTAPHESSIYLCWCLLESIAQMPWKGRLCDLFGSSVRAAGNLPSVVPFCNPATLSLPNYW